MKKKKQPANDRRALAAVLITAALFLTGCSFQPVFPFFNQPETSSTGKVSEASQAESGTPNPEENSSVSAETAPEQEAKQEDSIDNTAERQLFLEELPEFSGEACSVIHGNIPFFTEEDITEEVFERYSPLDELGRCGPAFAGLHVTALPEEERGRIGDIRPSGWHTVKYEGIDGNYLYNRCHLIAYCLAGENANERNLITGTRYLNVEGMLPVELEVLDFVVRSRMHVLYRATPVFIGEELVARGVLIEARSVEDGGAGLSLCIYCFNVQPGVQIDYATGESTKAG